MIELSFITEKLKLIKDLNWLFSLGEKLLSCFIVIILGTVLIKISKPIIRRAFKVSPRLNERKSSTLSTVCESIFKYIIYFFIFCHILTKFGIDVTSLIAVAGVGSVALAFGAQNLVQDLLAGVFILMEDQFGIGDFINIDTLSGTVESIGIRTTRLRSADGNLHIIPNGQIKIVTNMSKGFNRAVVDILIPHNENVDKIIDILKDELKNIYSKGLINGLIKEPEVLGINAFSENGVEIRISADTKIGENWTIERELRRIIKNRLDKESVGKPYPHEIIHIVKNTKEE